MSVERMLLSRWRTMNNVCHGHHAKPTRKQRGGISVCDAWRGKNGFENFKKWALSHGFSPELYSICEFLVQEEVGRLTSMRELRLAAGLWQIDVAKKMNVDQGAVSKWESGENKPSRKYHKKLAKLYGVTVAELAQGLGMVPGPAEKEEKQ